MNDETTIHTTNRQCVSKWLCFLSGPFFSRMLYNKGLIMLAILISLVAMLTPIMQPATALAAVNTSTGYRPGTLRRLSQLDRGQYASASEYQLWRYSDSSAAVMAEIMNAYNSNSARYRITDLLQVEEAKGLITPVQGMIDSQGIARTMSVFGFTAVQLSSPSLGTLLYLTQQGYPVIVSVFSSDWPGGHLLVVTGGNAHQVFIVDSSPLDVSQWPTKLFQQNWQGYAVIAVPTNESVLHTPTISASFINQVLAYYHSPAKGTGQTLFTLGVQYGIDPAFALGFFMHESTFGTAGIARFSRSLGNLRCIPGAVCRDNFAWFPTWQAGYVAWYRLIASSLYVGDGLISVPLIIPRYAPVSDHNNDVAYIADVMSAIALWRQGIIA
jgi:hypothetical protein